MPKVERRKADRSARACHECRKAKQGCDGVDREFLCSRCRRRGLSCTWPSFGVSRLREDNSSEDDVGLFPSSQQQEKTSGSDVLPMQLPAEQDRFVADHDPVASSSSEAQGPSPPRLGHSVGPVAFEEGLDDNPLVSIQRAARRHHHQEEDGDEDEDEEGRDGQEGRISDGRKGSDASVRLSASAQESHTQGSTTVEPLLLHQIRETHAQWGWTSADLHAFRQECLRYIGTSATDRIREPASLRALDPIEGGLLSEADARALFDIFFSTINNQTAILDDQIHTWDTVRKQSLVLFLTVLSTAAAVTQEGGQRSRWAGAASILSSDAEEACWLSIRGNVRSVEAIQALLLSYLFPPKSVTSNADNSWIFIDTAMRFACQLKLDCNEIMTKTSNILEKKWSGSGFAQGSQQQQRQKRNEERTWLNIVLLERTLGTFTDARSRQALDSDSVDWPALRQWADSPYAIPGDVQLAGWLHLRALEHRTVSQLPHLSASYPDLVSVDSMQVSFESLFASWRQYWTNKKLMRANPFQCNYMLTITTTIRLLTNIKLLQVARKQHGAHSKVTVDARRRCVSIAKEVAEHFVQSFEKTARNLSRNVVLMMGWTALVLIKLDFERGALPAYQVALAFTGPSKGYNSQLSFNALYGGLLLSVFQDLSVRYERSKGPGIRQRRAEHPSESAATSTNNVGVQSKNPAHQSPSTTSNEDGTFTFDDLFADIDLDVQDIFGNYDLANQQFVELSPISQLEALLKTTTQA